MLRFFVSERAGAELPGIDLDGVVAIGSAPDANIRLPAASARAMHVRIERDRWYALADAIVDGAARLPGTGGALGPGGRVIEIGAYRVRVARAPAGVPASSPQRTESLARELMRGILGEGSAPVLEIVRGPNAGARRTLPPPEAALVIGRGDDADWVIHDEDLSRRHVEIVRGWEGTSLRDLESQNGTRVDGKQVTELQLHDGMRIAIGNLELAFEDLAERHLRASAKASVIEDAPAPRPAGKPRRTALPFAIALAVAASAIAGLVYLLAS